MPLLSDPRSHGWRQGRLVSRTVKDRIRELNLTRVAIGDEDICVIASQDCDLCCESFEEEPEFEVVVGRRLPDDRLNGNLLYGKNPRKLQLWIEIGDEQKLYELSILERIAAPRQLLAEATDDPQGSLSSSDIDAFRRWLGRRYHRAALPTEFNERCRPAQSYIGDKLKKQGALITAIYLQIDPRYDELGQDDTYRVVAYLVVTQETAQSPDLLRRAVLAQASFEKAFARCNGIELLEAQVVSEAEFSLQDIQHTARWDHLDQLSYRTAGALSSED